MGHDLADRPAIPIGYVLGLPPCTWGSAARLGQASADAQPLHDGAGKVAPDAGRDRRAGGATYEAMCAHLGETMAVVAEAVGASARELNRPATVLRRTSRVRRVGQRQYTRHFRRGVARSGRQQRGRRRPAEPRRAARGLEGEDVTPLLPCGVRDGHHPRSEMVASFTLGAEGAAAPEHHSRGSRSAWLLVGSTPAVSTKVQSASRCSSMSLQDSGEDSDLRVLATE